MQSLSFGPRLCEILWLFGEAMKHAVVFGVSRDTATRWSCLAVVLLAFGPGCRPTDEARSSRDAGSNADARDLADAGSAPPDRPFEPEATDTTKDPADASGKDSGSGADAGPDAAADAGSDLGSDSAPDLGRDLGPDSAPSCVTAPAAKANFPFPQNRFGQSCIRPTNYSNDDVERAFCQWKSDTVTTDGVGKCPDGGCLRVRRPNEPGTLEKDSTVSEGIAYGMLIAVYMNDQTLFDGLWKYEQQFLDEHGLMHWYIKADGSGPAGNGGATDADEDMAFALLMADKQWGGQGVLKKSYLDYAKGQIGNIWANEIVDSKGVKPGEWGDWGTLNISYFAPSYYKTFASVDSGHPWNDVIKSSYDVIENSLNDANGNKNNGLVPAWVSCGTNSCSPNPNAWGDKPGQSPTTYQYDSCRTPFRVGLDYCWNASSRAQSYLGKTSNFFSGKGAANIVDGYKTDGTPAPASSGKSAAFIGTAAVGAMSSTSYQSFVDDAYASVATLRDLTGGTYYEDSWTVLSLLALTGNFFDFTAPPSK
jgi:endo-1,4-beta-D-glucanase Y